MSLSINTNTISLAVQRSFNSTTSKMNEAMKKMTTGFKINSAADDAAGYGVVRNMESIISTYDVAETNGQMGSSLLRTQEGILEIVGQYVQRIRDLTEQAANGTYAETSREAIASEVKQRMNEINRMCDIADFNGLKLLDGTHKDNGINLQVGVNSGIENVIVLDGSLFASAKVEEIMEFSDLHSASLRYDDGTNYKYKVDIGGTDYFFENPMIAAIVNTKGNNVIINAGSAPAATATAASILTDANGDSMITMDVICDCIFTDDNSARAFLDIVDLAVTNVTKRATEIGSYMNRVDSAVESLAIQKDNLTGAKSLIKDADVAKVSSEYLAYQILQQAGASMLTTANQAPQIALNLI